MSVPVRPCEIPAKVRLAAVQPASAREHDPAEKKAILQAALYPSDRVYWMSDTARALIQQWKKAA